MNITRTELLRGLIRSAADFGLVMGVVWLLSLASAAQHGRTFIALSLSVATIAAVDLALLRHLRRVYASPRRSGRRGGETGTRFSSTPPPHA